MISRCETYIMLSQIANDHSLLPQHLLQILVVWATVQSSASHINTIFWSDDSFASCTVRIAFSSCGRSLVNQRNPALSRPGGRDYESVTNRTYCRKNRIMYVILSLTITKSIYYDTSTKELDAYWLLHRLTSWAERQSSVRVLGPTLSSCNTKRESRHYLSIVNHISGSPKWLNGWVKEQSEKGFVIDDGWFQVFVYRMFFRNRNEMQTKKRNERATKLGTRRQLHKV